MGITANREKRTRISRSTAPDTSEGMSWALRIQVISYRIVSYLFIVLLPALKPKSYDFKPILSNVKRQHIKQTTRNHKQQV
mmetsp:Transcript_30479/g.43227  ORF Transcript_30479/g.43227 Transcript_30479/m.43227 type:complete len:81 (+) Transcript_30479:99-341(+)